MRITRDTLLRIAGDAVARNSRYNSEILAAYLVGSLLGEEYLLGGAADIDLVFVHAGAVQTRREIVRMSDEVHLDIAHYSQRDYRDTRALRIDPWNGPALTTCKVMYDPQHFLDFTRASVRGQFDRADFVFERARRQLEAAREIWMGLQVRSGGDAPTIMKNYLYSLELTANSIASLTGSPLTERRFLAGYRTSAETAGRGGLYSGMMGLLGASNLPSGALLEWFVRWQDAYLGLADGQRPARLHADRLVYYTGGFRALLDSPQPLDVLWPLLNTWTRAAALYPPSSPHVVGWLEAAEALGMTGQAFDARLTALDSYLDTVDEILESWARTNGVWQS